MNFPIKDGTINCNAKCKNPKDYYNLSTYIDFIDYELSLYNRLKHEKSWDDCYPEVCKSVNRNNLKYDKKLFTPVPHLKFTLEQNKILDLLMGAKLYSDEYACLRELYQNSLDACRCQIAIDKSKGKESKGKIEFGLENDEDGNKYVYCLDNGKGSPTVSAKFANTNTAHTTSPANGPEPKPLTPSHIPAVTSLLSTTFLTSGTTKRFVRTADTNVLTSSSATVLRTASANTADSFPTKSTATIIPVR